MNRGFSLLELLIAAAILLLVSALAIPAYRSYARREAAKTAAVLLENACLERKGAAAALGASGGICLGQSSYRSYQYDPFSSGSVSFLETKDLSSILGMPVACVVNAAPSSPNPCNSNEANLSFSPQPSGSSDWTGSISFLVQGETWRLTASNGVYNDGP